MIVLSIVLSYLLGSISTSTLVSKLFARIDIREHGSGNAGATNTLRVLGVRWAVVVLAVDVFKGMVAVFIAWGLGHGNPTYAYLSGLAVIAGHNWPIFFGFRGGKGIATTIGVLVLLLFVPTGLAGIVAIVLLTLTRYVSLAALSFTVLTTVFVALLQPHRIGAIVFAALVAVLSIWRHRKNIDRLVKGKENRIFSRRY